MTFRLILGNLLAHPIRSLLTMGSVFLAVFLLCFLQAAVSTLSASVEQAASNRLLVQSAVSLYVNLPRSYESRIATVPGVERVCKFQWFGGIYKDESNFFAQFGIDADELLECYPEISIVDGDYTTFQRNRTGCIVGTDLAKTYGFKVGDTIQITGQVYGRIDGEPWSFKVEAIYSANTAAVEKNTLYFHYDYLKETVDAGETYGPEGVGVYLIKVAEGADASRIMSSVDLQYENGPIKVRTMPEAEFSRQFLTMLGNVPLLLQSIGGAVLFAIFFAVLNSMLMAGRERTRDIGVMKALGFTDGMLFRNLVAEALILSSVGGLLGIGLAKGLEPVLQNSLAQLQGFSVGSETLVIGFAISIGIGLFAGIAPGLRIRKLTPLQALREEG